MMFCIQQEAFRIAQSEGRSLIHPFDDPHVIAGNATVAMEILKEVRTYLPCFSHLLAAWVIIRTSL